MSKQEFLKYLGFHTAAAIAASKITSMSKEPSIEQVNEAIAIFDGWEKKSPREFVKDGYVRYVWEFKYHERWNELMPVWKKLIDKVSGQSEDGIYPADFSTIMDMYAYHCERVEIVAAYNYVLKGITWSNSQQTTTNDRQGN